MTDADEIADVVRVLQRTCETCERSIQGWIEGRVEPTEENRARFAAMKESARAACEVLPLCRDRLPAELCDRFVKVRDWLDTIVEVGLAQEAIDRLVAALGEVKARERAKG
jgi:hypothetical protein